MAIQRPKPLTDDQRRELLARVVGCSHRLAAARLGVAMETVREWRKKFRGEPAALPPLAMPPDFTEEVAEVYAQLLHAGCPALHGTALVYPAGTVDEHKALTKLWLASPMLTEAVERLQGGAWVQLPAEKRYELALAKHLSEAAFFLYANNFNEAANRDALEMFKQARELLKAELKGNVDELDPMQAFARFALEMVKGKMVEQSANSRQPIDLQPSGMDRIHEEMTKVSLPRSGEKLN